MRGQRIEAVSARGLIQASASSWIPGAATITPKAVGSGLL